MEVVKDLTCPICLEFYSHPVILPCSHIMCKQPCADQLFEGNFIRCPVCRDNCYVSGGLPSLPRVITIESIIEKIRAERKKRNANGHGQARESSFDDLFSDGTSEIRGGERTPVSSPSSVAPICNSPSFPEGRSSPVSFSPELTNGVSSSPDSSLRPISSGSLSSTPDTFTPSIVSSQTCTPRSQSEDTLTEGQVQLNNVSLPHRLRQNDRAASNPSFSHSTRTQFSQYLPTFPNNTRESVPRNPPNNICHFTTRRPSNSSPVSQVAETYSVTRRSRQNTRTVNLSLPHPNSHLNHENAVSQSHQINSRRSFPFNPSVVEGAGTEGIFTPEQVVQTSTPRSDLRNIRLCHEQSLANLKACSDSIKALQQSRPFYRNGSCDSNFDPLTSERSDGTNVDNPYTTNEGNETRSFLGHITDILFDSSGSDGSPRTNEAENTLVSSPFFPSNCYTDQYHNTSSVGSTNVRASHFDRGQPVSAPDSNDASGNISSEIAMACDGQHDSTSQHVDENGEVSTVKLSIQNHLQRLCDIQNQLLFHMNSFTERTQVGEDQFDKGRSDINKECDSLVAEIENKRYHFLLHIDDERKRRRLETNDTAIAMQKLLASSQELSLFVEEMLESRPQTILSTASSLLDSLSSAVIECQACLQQTSTESNNDAESNNCDHHLIDTRLQRSIVQELDYLSLPERPVFCVERCTRNTSTVSLVLQPPAFGNAIDHYEIVYCSEEQKALGIEERYYAKMQDDPDLYSGINQETFPVILIENLCQSTHYFFCASAVNRKGKSMASDYVQCKTLAERDSVVPAPSILENRCQVNATSVTLTCPSLATVTLHQRVHHCLLQKSNNGAFVWKGVELSCTTEEFPVRKLRPEMHYNFAVIAFNGRGECQVSNIVGLQTHPLEPVNFV